MHRKNKSNSFLNFFFNYVRIMHLSFPHTLSKILKHKRLFKAIHWDPCELTHFNTHFDKDSELWSSKYLLKCVNLQGSQWIALKCSLCCRIFLTCKYNYQSDEKYEYFLIQLWFKKPIFILVEWELFRQGQIRRKRRSNKGMKKYYI